MTGPVDKNAEQSLVSVADSCIADWPIDEPGARIVPAGMAPTRYGVSIHLTTGEYHCAQHVYGCPGIAAPAAAHPFPAACRFAHS